jgi:hypothetical protein
MKKVFVILMVTFCMMFFASYCFADNYDNALKEIKAEKKVLDASWGPFKGSSLYVAVKDDGTNRTGYAQYLCIILHDHNIKGIIIHVMTLNDMRKFNTDNDLGRFICE